MLNRALKLLRLFHEMDQYQLAQDLNISRSYLSELECGKKQPTLELLERYAIVFAVPVPTLLLFSEALEAQRFSERLRIRGANKVLRILEWFGAREGAESPGTNLADRIHAPENV